MSTLTDSLGTIVDALTEVGIAATTDPRDLVVPGAWVTVNDVTDPMLCGGATVRAAVCLIASDNGAPYSLDALGDLLDKALPAVTIDEPARPMTVTPPGRGPLPALVIITTT